MDTHMHTTPDLDGHGVSAARLPGEPDPDTYMAPADDARPARATCKQSGRRSRLLSAAIFGLVPVVAFGAFVVSPYNHVIPLPLAMTAQVHRLADQTRALRDRLVVPSASLAAITLSPRPEVVVADPYQPKPNGEALAEVLSLRRPDKNLEASRAEPAPGTSSPATAPSPPALRQPPSGKPSKPEMIAAEPGELAGAPAAALARATPRPEQPAPVSASPRVDVTPSVVSAATHPTPAETTQDAATAPREATTLASAATPLAPALVPVVPAANVAPARPPADPVQQAAVLRPEPMADEKQIEVLQLVTRMAAELKAVQVENAALRSDVAKGRSEWTARLRDFERRISLAEARRAVDAASAPPAAEPSAPAQPAPAANNPMVRPISVTSAETVVPEAASDRKRYRVQAASPGLAMLTEIARGGGDGAQVQVVVGDALPGWGKVKSVSQRGTSWVVATDRGTID